jgi:hypothetical protein
MKSGRRFSGSPVWASGSRPGRVPCREDMPAGLAIERESHSPQRLPLPFTPPWSIHHTLEYRRRPAGRIGVWRAWAEWRYVAEQERVGRSVLDAGYQGHLSRYRMLNVPEPGRIWVVGLVLPVNATGADQPWSDCLPSRWFQVRNLGSAPCVASTDAIEVPLLSGTQGVS